MSYKSKESKVFNSLTDSQQVLLRGRTIMHMKAIGNYIDNINHVMETFTRPDGRLYYLCASLFMHRDSYGRTITSLPLNNDKVIRVLINNSCNERDASSYDEETVDTNKHYEFALLAPTEICVIDGCVVPRDNSRLCHSIMRPDERYEFCFSDKSPCCQYRYVSKYIMRHGAKHYVIDCSLDIFKEKESIIKFCNALIGLFNDGEFKYDGLGKLELPDFGPTEPFHIENSEPLESDSTKYDRYLMDGERKKAEKVETGGCTVKFDVENTCKFWLAKDKDGGCFCYISKPIRDNIRGQWISVKSWLPIDNKFFPELKWEDEPLEVVLIPVIKS